MKVEMSNMFNEMIEQIADAVIERINSCAKQPSTSSTPGAAGNEDEYITKQEAGKRLGLSEGTVGVWMRTGKLPYIRRGNRVYISKEVVDKAYLGKL